jgi:hypothetical protein
MKNSLGASFNLKCNFSALGHEQVELAFLGAQLGDVDVKKAIE